MFFCAELLKTSGLGSSVNHNSGTSLSALDASGQDGVLALLLVSGPIHIKLVAEPLITRDHPALRVPEIGTMGGPAEVGYGVSVGVVHLSDGDDAVKYRAQAHSRDEAQRVADIANGMASLRLHPVPPALFRHGWDLQAPLLGK
jgi:hypothetical protein